MNPEELTVLPQWVCWRWEERDGKLTKPPLSAHTGKLASTTDPATWASFEETQQAAGRLNMAGSGFVFTPGDPYAGIDLDTCRNPATGAIKPWAQAIVDALDSYTEVSPSGTGVKIFTRATLPRCGRKGDVEIYDRGRYFTVTGEHLEGTPTTIEERHTQVAALCQRVFGSNGKKADSTNVETGDSGQIRSPSAASTNVESADAELIERAKAAGNGAKFSRLWEGNTTGYDSASEADLALVNILRFWAGDDRSLIDNLFRQSGLFRPKWDEPHYGDGRTYGEATITTALDGGGDTYQPTIVQARAAPSVEIVLPRATPTPTPAEAVSLPFHTAREIGATVSPEVKWIAKPWVAAGSVTELTGRAKASGKTTLGLHMVAAVVNDGDFLGEKTARTSVVYLTEERPTTFREHLRRAGLLECDSLHILYWTDTRGVKWPDIVAAAVAECQRVGARLLVVDTLSQFAGLRGEEENQSGAGLEAMEPLLFAAALGIAVLQVRHERKGGGEVGEAGRGTTAFAAAVDIVLSLKRSEGNAKPNVRVLHALSRFDETPDTLVIELDGAEYRALGSTAAVALNDAKTALIAALPSSEDEAMTSKEIVESLSEGVKRTAAYEALKELTAEGLAVKAGSGKKGDPYKYHA